MMRRTGSTFLTAMAGGLLSTLATAPAARGDIILTTGLLPETDPVILFPDQEQVGSPPTMVFNRQVQAYEPFRGDLFKVLVDARVRTSSSRNDIEAADYTAGWHSITFAADTNLLEIRALSFVLPPAATLTVTATDDYDHSYYGVPFPDAPAGPVTVRASGGSTEIWGVIITAPDMGPSFGPIRIEGMAFAPEPATWTGLALGGLALAGYGWRRRRRLAA